MENLQKLQTKLIGDKGVGNAALLAEKRNIVEDLYSVFTEIEAETVRGRILPIASGYSEKSEERSGYLSEAVTAKKNDDYKIQEIILPQLEGIEGQVNILQSEIDNTKKVPQAVRKIEIEYSDKIQEVKTYLVQQENRLRELQNTYEQTIAKIVLFPVQESYMRDLEKRVKQEKLKQRNAIAKAFRIQPSEVDLKDTEYAEAPDFKVISEKIRKKR